MQKLRQYLAEVVDTERRRLAVVGARNALDDITHPDGLPILARHIADTPQKDRYCALLMETWNAQS